MAGSDNSFFIGPQVKENSFPVTIATDQLPLPVQLTATPTIDIGNVDQGLPGDISSAWPILVTDGIDVLGTPANPFRIDPTGSTVQPVNGSVAVINFPVSQLVDQGSAALLPGAWPVEITDGFAVLGTPSDPLRTDPTGSTIQPVSGGIIELGTVGSPVRVDPTGTTTQPVSGSVNANITALPNFAPSSTVSSLNGTIQANVNTGASTVIFVVSGTWVGKLVLEGVSNTGSLSTIKAVTYGLLPTGNGAYIVPCGGFTSVQVRMSEYTSGTAAVVMQSTCGANVTQSLPVQADGLNRYRLPLSIRQTAATGAGSTVFAMRNSTSSVRKVYIEKLDLLMTFDGTAAAGVTKKYDLVRFSAATPTAGTALTVIKNDTDSDTSNITDARFLDTGLSMTSVVFETAFMTLAQAISVTAQTNFINVSNDPVIVLKPGEGFCIRLNIAATVGEGINGSIVWSER